LRHIPGGFRGGDRHFQPGDFLEELHLGRDDVGVFQDRRTCPLGGGLGEVFGKVERLALPGEVFELTLGDGFLDAALGEFRPVHGAAGVFGRGKTHL